MLRRKNERFCQIEEATIKYSIYLGWVRIEEKSYKGVGVKSGLHQIQSIWKIIIITITIKGKICMSGAVNFGCRCGMYSSKKINNNIPVKNNEHEGAYV